MPDTRSEYADSRRHRSPPHTLMLMTSTIDLDRPIRTPRPGGRRRRWLIGLAAVAGAAGITVGTAGAAVLPHDGNKPLPPGVRTVQVYTVDDAISTAAPL